MNTSKRPGSEEAMKRKKKKKKGMDPKTSLQINHYSKADNVDFT